MEELDRLMEDMPALKEKFANYDAAAIVKSNSPDTKLEGVERYVSEMIIAARDYLGNTAYEESLPPARQVASFKVIKDIETLFDRILELQPDISGWVSQREGLKTDIIARYNDAYTELIFPQRVYELHSKGDEVVKDLKRIQDKARKEERLIDDAATASAATARSGGMEYSGVAFDDAYKGYEAEAKKWLDRLYYAIGFSVILGIVLLKEVNLPGLPELRKVLVENQVATILLVTVLIYGIRFIIRNYNAYRHLAVTNMHRRDVLQTLPAYIVGLSPELQEVITVMGAKTAFDTGESGFITTKEGAGGDNDAMSHWLLELAKRNTNKS